MMDVRTCLSIFTGFFSFFLSAVKWSHVVLGFVRVGAYQGFIL